ncbi:MAG: PIN domain-containing protein [Candidatus Limnocylindria bacterium]|nr:PIN domain-containing protein [Candidatus Limnocylindria bacterium]
MANAIPAVWIDANVLLRHAMRDDPGQFRQVESLFDRAERGEILLRFGTEIVMESIWAMTSEFGLSRQLAARTLAMYLNADGVEPLDRELVEKALSLVAEFSVDPADAFLAVRAARSGEPVASFDRDLRKLGVELVKL